MTRHPSRPAGTRAHPRGQEQECRALAAEGRGHPWAAALLGLSVLTLVIAVVVLLADVLGGQHSPWVGDAVQVALPAAVIVGFLSALSLRDRGGHPVAAFLVVVATVAVVGAAGFGLGLTMAFSEDNPDTAILPAEAVPWVVVLALGLGCGLWLAWRVGRAQRGAGGWGARGDGEIWR